jgi:hypothetical protein
MGLFDGRTVDFLTNLQSNLRLWMIICGLVSLTAGGVTVLLTFLNHKASDRIISLQRIQRDSEKADKESAQRKLASAIADVAAATAKAREAEAAALGATQHAKELEEQLADRTLSEEQKTILTIELASAVRSGEVKGGIALDSVVFNPESIAFRDQIAVVLKTIGWPNEPANSIVRVFAGVRIYGFEPGSESSAAKVRAIFKDAGIESSTEQISAGGMASNFKEPGVYILIGTKPKIMP